MDVVSKSKDFRRLETLKCSAVLWDLMATRADSRLLTKIMSEMMATCPLSLQNLPQTIMTRPQLLLPQNAIPIHVSNVQKLGGATAKSLGIGGRYY